MKIDSKVIERSDISVSMPEAWKYTWEILIAHDEIERMKKRFLKSYGSRMDVPGFRKGKIPVSMIRQQFGDSLDSVFVEELGAGYLSYLKERDQIIHIHDAQYSLDTDSEGGDMLVIEGEVVPAFNLSEYKGLKATMHKQRITDAAVEAFLERIRETHSRFRPKDEPLARGDAAQISLRKVGPGGVVLVGEEEQTITVSIAEDAIPGELLAALVGKTAGARLEVPLPEKRSEMIETPGGDTDARELYSVRVDAAFSIEVPTNDEISALFGLDDPDEIPIRTRIILEDESEERARKNVRKELVTRIARQTEIPLPPSMVRDRAEEYRTSYIKQIEEEGRTPEQELTDQSYFFDKFREQIELHLKEIFIIDKVASVEHLFPTKEEWKTAIDTLAREEGTTPKSLIRKLGSEGTESLMRRITRTKVERFLEDEADIDVDEHASNGVPLT